jgi:hypothetical protein
VTSITIGSSRSLRSLGIGGSQLGAGYILVNQTKKEQILFAHISASKKRELAGGPISAAITTWYLLEHPGDSIAFISDTYGEWPFKSGSPKDLFTYKDVTDEIISSLIKAEILQDEGREIFDESEPNVYMRKLRNIWWFGSTS